MVTSGGFTAVPAGLGHFWSLAVEEQFYLLWPFLVWALGPRHLLKVCGALVVGAWLARIAAVTISPNTLISYLLLPTRIDTLALGAILSLTLLDPRKQRLLRRAVPYAVVLAVALLAGLLIASPAARSFSAYEPMMQVVGYTGIALLAALAVHRGAVPGVGRGARILTWTGLRRLGLYSYGLYVFHVPVQHVWHQVADPRLDVLLGGHSAVLFQVVSVAGQFAISAVIAVAELSLLRAPFPPAQAIFPEREGWSGRRAAVGESTLASARGFGSDLERARITPRASRAAPGEGPPPFRPPSPLSGPSPRRDIRRRSRQILARVQVW